MKQALLAAFAAVLIIIISCQKSNDKAPSAGALKPPPQSRDVIDIADTDTVQILDALGQPLANAKVLIGDQESPENPWLITDDKGQVGIPESWTDPKDLTVSAPGFIQLTLKSQLPNSISVTLHKKALVPQYSMKGGVSGITTKDKDGWVDFAVVMDSMSKNDIFNFNINKVMSPWLEKISVAGFEFPVPQNLFLPKQKESYIFSVTIQKPWFNLSYNSYGTKSLYALIGKFPLKKMISEIQNKKPYYELVNYFDFSSSGPLAFDFTGPSSSPTIDASQITLDKALTTKGPKLQNNEVTLGISAYKQNDFYQPLDIKYIGSEETVNFKTSSTVTSPYLIGVVKNKSEFDGNTAPAERMSVSLDAPKKSVAYLPLLKDPAWSTSSELFIEVPPLDITEFSDQGMLVVISERQEVTLADGNVVKFKVPVWEVHLPEWTNKITLPNLNPASAPSKRVEVTFMAKVVDSPGQQNAITLTSSHEERIENATHLTKSALDY